MQNVIVITDQTDLREILWYMILCVLLIIDTIKNLNLRNKHILIKFMWDNVLGFEACSILAHYRKTKNNIKLFYRETSNIRRTLVGNEIVDHSDVIRSGDYA